MASARRFAWVWSSLAFPCRAASWVAWAVRCATCAACSRILSISPICHLPRRAPGTTLTPIPPPDFSPVLAHKQIVTRRARTGEKSDLRTGLACAPRVTPNITLGLVPAPVRLARTRHVSRGGTRDPPRRRTPLGAPGMPSSRGPAPGLQRHVSLLLLKLSSRRCRSLLPAARLPSRQKERQTCHPGPIVARANGRLASLSR